MAKAEKNSFSKEVKKVEKDVETFAEKVNKFFEEEPIHYLILACIFIVATVSGLQTIHHIKQKYGEFLEVLEKGIHCLFVIEMAFRIIVTKKKFFQNYWNIFDLTLILATLYPSPFTPTVLIIFRGLTSLNVLNIFPKTRHIIQGLAKSTPGIISVCFLAFIFFYAFSLISTELYREYAPELFGDIGISMRTLFSMVGEFSWLEISQTMTKYYPDAWIFLMIFNSILGYFVFNLVVGTIVGAMSEVVEDDMRRKGTHPLDNHIKSLKEELAEIKRDLALSKRK
ncbi:MAG: ion transporter [Candidatus Paracaedimonas acanthamoebae]|uniref:Ion transporter n=1 Tax=Candidatus Paracaedimonas acanthamoebae TaxID=244581 RepID=A0A8J7PMI5_9PROT|nr:ion transporter [Candidatus Paracaedimonas acanthamoebae]